jgi:hypothetical protein
MRFQMRLGDDERECRELWRILGDEADQAALCTGIGMTSVPS